MSQFMSGLNDTLVNACRSAMLNTEMDIARLMTHKEEVEGQNMKNKGFVSSRGLDMKVISLKVEVMVVSNHKGKSPIFQIIGSTKISVQ